MISCAVSIGGAAVYATKTRALRIELRTLTGSRGHSSFPEHEVSLLRLRAPDLRGFSFRGFRIGWRSGHGRPGNAHAGHGQEKARRPPRAVHPARRPPHDPP